MMGIGFPELMIILVIIMIIFGAGKLPEIGNAFGNSIKNFKRSMKEAEEENDEAGATEALDENGPAKGEIEDGEGEPEPTKEADPSSQEPLAK
ncbi:MAG: hypothetical protein NPINA01_00900 [Nitrospinaceae bacterium]|nr:MAG: hypothetical protein NPINA01_00900 [Nitrospinaceae bacterium]